MISTSWLLVSFVLAAALPSLAEAQIPYGAPAPAYAPEERARLLARTDTELAVDPIPADPVGLALELALLEAQLDEIDAMGTNILQWSGGPDHRRSPGRSGRGTSAAVSSVGAAIACVEPYDPCSRASSACRAAVD